MVLSVISAVIFLSVFVIVNHFAFGAYNYTFTTKEGKIQLLHLFAGFFHVVSSLALGWLANSEPVVWEAPTYTLVSIWQNTTNSSCSEVGKCFVATELIRGQNIPIAILAVLFGIISGFAHILAGVVVGPEKLTEYAETGTNWTRWADYTLSASLMIVVIACLSGVLDSYVLSTIGLFQAFLLCGAYFIEKDLADAYIHNVDTRARGLICLTIACLFYVPGVWGPVVGSFYESIESAPSDVPEWINAMIWILFVLFSSFIGIMIKYLVFTGDPNMISENIKKRTMILQELGYICLSLTSKITLHWVLFTGITSRSGVLFATEEEATDPLSYHRTGEDSRTTTSRVFIATAASIAFGLIFYFIFRIYILREYPSKQSELTRYSFIG